jgi:hypothetical protein
MANNLCTDRWTVAEEVGYSLCTDRWGIAVEAGYDLCTDYWSLFPEMPVIPPHHIHAGHGRYVHIWDEDLTDEEVLILATYYLMRTDIEL